MGSRGALTCRRPPPTPTCAAARRPAGAGGRETPGTGVARSTDGGGTTRAPNRVSSCRDFPARVALWLPARLGLASQGRAVRSPSAHRARSAGRTPTYPERGARAEGAAHARALSPARRLRGAARPRGIAPRPGGGSDSAPRLPRALALTGSRWEGAPRPARRSRGLRAASAAPPGPGRDDVRLGAGVRGAGRDGGVGGEPVPRAPPKSPRPNVLRLLPAPGAGLPERVRARRRAGRRTPDPRRPPSTLVAPTPRQGLAGRPGGAGKSRPPPPTSLVRHGGSRARAPRTPRAPRPARPPAGRAPPRGPALRSGCAHRPGAGGGAVAGAGGGGRGAAVIAGFPPLRLPRPPPGLGVSSGTSEAGGAGFQPPQEMHHPPRPQRRRRVERRSGPVRIHEAPSRSPAEGPR